MARQIRVCQVINSFVVGGAETVALDLSRKLDPTRFEVRLLAPFKSEAGNGIPEMERRFRDAGVPIDKLEIASFHNPWSIFRLYQYFRRGHFDIVHGHNRLSDAWAVEIGALAGIPVRFWTRHLVYQDMTPVLVWRYARLAGKVDMVFAVSEAVRQNCIEIEGIPEQKLKTITNGIDTERYAPASGEDVAATRRKLGLAPDESMILFVGRLNEQKAPDGFVHTIWKLRESGCRLRGFMCGTGPLEDEIRSLIDGGPGGVTMLGLRNDVPELIAATDLFVSTSRNEGLPLNVMEAMSGGAAVLAPDIEQVSCLLTSAELRDVCLMPPPPPNGPLPDSLIDAWAEKVRDTLANENRRKRIGKESRELIRAHHSLNSMVVTYQEMYEERLQARSVKTG
ncbi:glycosyltransferase [bacterium]|nr:glycosyltransferase [bacterium]